MKKFGFLLAVSFLAIGSIFTQNQNERRISPPEPVTIEGSLQLKNGIIALASGDTVYYVPMLQRYIGFIDGLKEGNAVSVEGYAYRDYLRPIKVTIGEKSYDFPAIGFGRRPGQGFGQRRMPGFEPGRNQPRPMFGRGPNGRPGSRNDPRQRNRMENGKRK